MFTCTPSREIDITAGVSASYRLLILGSDFGLKFKTMDPICSSHRV